MRARWRRWAAAGVQATTVVHRVARVLGRPVTAGPAGRAVLGRRSAADDRTAAAGDRAPAAGDRTPAAGDDLVLREVLDRARAAGVPPAPVHALAEVWADLTPVERRTVHRPLGDGRAGPLRVGGAPVRQVDGTTCGSTALAMLAAAGDPVLALWLVTGRLLPGHLPPELRAMAAGSVLAPDAGDRFAALQRAVQRASTRRALGPLPWPAALGTPPWGAARTARFPGVTWTHVLVDDTDPVLVGAVLDRADAALAAGVPVALYTGGDLRGGLAAAVPRHVVLLVPVPGRSAPGSRSPAGAYAVLEPSRGTVHRVTRDTLARPGGPHPALGGWSHVCWAVLPCRTAPRRRAARPAPGAAWHTGVGRTTMEGPARPPSTQEEP